MLDLVLNIAIYIGTIAGILAVLGFFIYPKAGKVFLNFFILAMLIVVAAGITRTGDYNIFTRGVVGVYDELKDTVEIAKNLTDVTLNVLQRILLVCYTVIKYLLKIPFYIFFMYLFCAPVNNMIKEFRKKLFVLVIMLYGGLFLASIVGTFGMSLNPDDLLKYEGYIAILFFSVKAGTLVLTFGKEERLLQRSGRNFQNHGEETSPSTILLIGFFVARCWASMFLDAMIWSYFDRKIFGLILGV